MKNAGKVRLEGISDIALNSVLAEFHTGLHERYDLLYIDASYGGEAPSLSLLENRLKFYMNQNMDYSGRENRFFRSRMFVKKVSVNQFGTAADTGGNSMKNQAAGYIRDTGINRKEAQVSGFLEEIRRLDGLDREAEWRALQEEIAGMELPVITDEKGRTEEIALGNPADGFFALSGSDILYLADISIGDIGIGAIKKEDYISERKNRNEGTVCCPDKGTEEEFLTYLFEKMGCYGAVREKSLLNYQLEYIGEGKSSDWENLRAVAERLMKWRFGINAAYAMSDTGLYQEALSAAQMLHAVQLKKEFEEPVAKSILYACAYLESIRDLRSILKGGRAALRKTGFKTTVAHILSGGIPEASSEDEEGLDYKQYLACLLLLTDKETRQLRCMDVMEMDIRYISGNPHFSMDWCLESIEAAIEAGGSAGSSYVLNRRYGYY